MSKKRKRDIRAIDTQLVEIYDDLANADEDIRLKAAQSLLLKISPSAGLTNERLHEILRRLIRGLCSGRKAARLGFSVALTEFLIQVLNPLAKHPSSPITRSEVIEFLKEQTQYEGNVSGQEERDHQFGRLFGSEALIKSAILFHASVDIQYWDQVLELIIELERKKQWLREECGWILYNAIQHLGNEGHDSKYTQLIIDKVHNSHLTKTPEGTAIWILTAHQFPQVKLPKGVWHHKNPLHREEKAELAKVLKDASSHSLERNGSDSRVSNTGSWTPRLHFVWDVVLGRILSRQSQNGLSHKESKKLDLATFWNECVDESLFADTSSQERKYWGFLIFQRALRDTPSCSIPFIFSKHFMRCLMNQLALPERYLHRIADKSINAIYERVGVDESSAVPVLESLLGPPNGTLNFDHISKTKTVEKTVTLVKNTYLKDLVQFFRRLILQPGTPDQEAAAIKRQFFADQLVNLVKSRSNGTDFDSSSAVSHSFQDILSLFTNIAYFNVIDDSKISELSVKPPISLESQNMFKSRISSCLTHLIPISADPTFFPYFVVSQIHANELDGISKPVLERSDASSQTLQEAWRVLAMIHAKLESPDCAKKSHLAAFKLLFSLTILQVLNFDADAVSMLDELKDCYEKLVNRREHDVREGSDVLIEIILSYVAKPSQLFRRLGQQVFSALACDVNEAGLQSMIKVLLAKENMSGQEEMFDRVDEQDGEDEISDVQEIDMFDVSAAGSPAKDGKSVDEDPDEKNSSNGTAEDEDDSEVDEMELAAFNAKLAQALGTQFAGDEKPEQEDDSDEEMDDEQMEALDVQIGKVFQERKNTESKKEQLKDARETIINFKCRVLELLDIFIKQHHTKPLSLTLLVPLLTTVQTTRSPLVSNKACEVIRKYTLACKKNARLPQLQDTTTALDLLEQVHQRATQRGLSKAHVACCSQASLLLAKTLAAHDRENLRQVLAVYGRTQERALFDPECEIRTFFFTDWLNWWTSIKK